MTKLNLHLSGLYRSIVRATRSYIINDPEWIYTIFFFLTFASVYVWEFRLNKHEEDKPYIERYIEEAEPRKQIELLSKFSKDEEFNVDREFLIKTIHVKPQISTKPIPQLSYWEVGKSYCFSEGDSAVYLQDGNEWIRASIPVNYKSAQAGTRSPMSVEFDETSIVLFQDTSEVWWTDGHRYAEAAFNVERGALGIELPDTIYFLRDFFAGVSRNSFTYWLNDSGDTTQYGTTFSLPGVVVARPCDDRLVIQTRDGSKNKLVALDMYSNLMELDERNVYADAFQWQAGYGAVTFNDLKRNILGVIDFEQDTKRIFQYGQERHFTKAPKVLRYNDASWAVGVTGSENAICIARLNYDKMGDTLRLIDIPDIEQLQTHFLNVNDHGVTLGGFVGEPRVQNMRLFYLGNDGDQFVNLELTDLLDSTLLVNLSSFEVNVPLSSDNFSLVVTNTLGIPISYSIETTKRWKDPVIRMIYDSEKASGEHIMWPSYQFYDIETNYDYFFIVILLIGIVMFYFFGLFYVLNFKNRDVSRDVFSAAAIPGLNSLQEKLGYSKRTMSSLKLRSEIMLWLGIVIGVLGMFAFVFSLKTFFKDVHGQKFDTGFVILLLRTFAIFGFMEVFSFYFLKQYRITFNEYKRFFSLYLRLMNYYQYIETVKNFPETDSTAYKEMREAILKDSFIMHEDSSMEKINEFERSVASDILKTLSNKIPNA